jgi:hypothetical protein
VSATRLALIHDPPLLSRWRYIRHSPLVHFSHSCRLDILAILLVRSERILLESRQGEPCVIVCPVVCQFLLVLDSPLAKNSKFNASTITVCSCQPHLTQMVSNVRCFSNFVYAEYTILVSGCVVFGISYSQAADLDLGKRARAN